MKREQKQKKLLRAVAANHVVLPLIPKRHSGDAIFEDMNTVQIHQYVFELDSHEFTESA